MDRNGYFKLKAANDGTYLKCYKPEGNGTGVKIDDVIFYLDSKGYKNFDVKALNIYIQENDFESRFKISDQTLIKENEFLQLDIDKYGLKVIGKFFPPTDGGDKMTVTDIIDELKRNNIVSGYVKKNIKIFVKARLYCTNILLDKAKMPILC